MTSPSGVKLLSVGQLVPAGQALAWRGPMAAGALAQLIDGDWGDVDLILVDLPPGTGDVQLSLVQKAKPVGAVIVSTPQDLALIDATRAIDLFAQDRRAGARASSRIWRAMPARIAARAAIRSEAAARRRRRRRSASPSSAACRCRRACARRAMPGTPPAGEEGAAGDAFAVLARALLDQLEKKPA